MEKEYFSIEGIPAILWGAPSDKVFLYIHGQGGSKEEAEPFAQIASAKNWQVLSIDLPKHGERISGKEEFKPWILTPELQEVLAYLKPKWGIKALCAQSIGAWFSMLAFPDEHFERCLFISPVLNMELLIKNMINWAGVTENRLKEEQNIPTNFGQELSWEYFQYARAHKIERWKSKTFILYPEKDHLTEADTAARFAADFGCFLTVAKGGEHWFHTPRQLEVLYSWYKEFC